MLLLVAPAIAQPGIGPEPVAGPPPYSTTATPGVAVGSPGVVDLDVMIDRSTVAYGSPVAGSPTTRSIFGGQLVVPPADEPELLEQRYGCVECLPNTQPQVVAIRARGVDLPFISGGRKGAATRHAMGSTSRTTAGSGTARWGPASDCSAMALSGQRWFKASSSTSKGPQCSARTWKKSWTSTRRTSAPACR